MRPRARVGRLGARAAVAAILMVGCGGGADEGPAPSADDSLAVGDTAADAAASKADGARPEEVEPDTVNVRLTEYRIQMPRSLRPGPTAFRVTNSGAVEHNFEIEGEGAAGMRERFGRDLHPTQTRTLTVTLEPGRYKIFCPVGMHLRRGGVLILEVSGPSSSGSEEG